MMELVLLMTLCLAGCLANEPYCKQYDYEEKILAKTIRTEFALELLEKKLEDMKNGIEERLDALEKPSVSGVLAQCPDGWVNFHDSCYLFAHNHLNFFDAEKFCQQKEGYLVHIETREENTFLRSFCGDLKVARRWIGLTDAVVEGRWLWHGTDISPSFFDWDPSQPNGGKGSNCGELWELRSYHWGDDPCTNLWQPICERPLNSNMEVVVAN